MRTNILPTALMLLILGLVSNAIGDEEKISEQEFRELRLLYETHLMSFPRYDVTIETKTIGVPRQGISDREFVSYDETQTIRQQLDVDAKRFTFAQYSTTHQVVPDGQSTDGTKMSTKEITRERPYVCLFHDGLERTRYDFNYRWQSQKVDAESAIRYSQDVAFIPAVLATLSNRVRLKTFSLEQSASEQKWVSEIQKVTKRSGDSVWLTYKAIGEQGEDIASEVVINRKSGAIERNTFANSFKGKQNVKRIIEYFYETIDGVARPMRARSEEWGHVSLDEESSHSPAAELLIHQTYTWHAFGDQEIQWMDTQKDYTEKELEAFIMAK